MRSDARFASECPIKAIGDRHGIVHKAVRRGPGVATVSRDFEENILRCTDIVFAVKTHDRQQS